MTEAFQRRGAPRRRRRPRRPAADQVPGTNGATAALTTITRCRRSSRRPASPTSACPPRIDDGPRRGRVRPTVHDPDGGHPGGDGRAATSAGGPAPAPARRSPSACRCWRASTTRRSRRARSASCSCRPASSPSRSPRCSSPVAAHAGQRILAVYGGASRHYQVDELRKGVEIVVATPLRLIDLLKSTRSRSPTSTSSCSTRPTGWPTTASPRRSSGSCATAPGGTQTMLFSATLDGDVGHLIRHYLKDPVEVAIDAATDTVGTMHHLFLAVHHMDKARVVAAIGQGIPEAGRVLPDEAAVRQGRVGAGRARRRRPGDPRRPAAGVSRAGAAQVRRGQAGRPRGHRRRGARPRHRRHRRRRPLRPAEGRQGLPAPLGPHGAGRSRRLGGHARRVQPAHPDAHPAAHAAAAAGRRRSRCSATTSACAT